MKRPTIFFAESCPYGVETLSDADQLFRFTTAAARDAWVANDDSDTPARLSLGPDSASRIYNLGGAGAAATVDPDGVMVPAEYSSDVPSIYYIGAG